MTQDNLDSPRPTKTVPAQNDSEQRTFFVGVFDRRITGPESRHSSALSFLTMTGCDSETPITKEQFIHAGSETSGPPAPASPAETGLIRCYWPRDDERPYFDIPPATDLSNPSELAVWTAIGHVPCYDQLFAEHSTSPDTDETGDADGCEPIFAVFEIDPRDEHETWAAANRPRSADEGGPDYVTRHERTVDPKPGEPSSSIVQRYCSWDNSVAPPDRLPDAAPLSDASRLITFHNGQDLHHSLGLYGVSTAESAPLAARDVLQGKGFMWPPEVHQVSLVETHTLTELCGRPSPAPPELTAQ